MLADRIEYPGIQFMRPKQSAVFKLPLCYVVLASKDIGQKKSEV